MLETSSAIATIAVKDFKAAAKFYEGTLGLEPTGDGGPEGGTYKSGNSTVLIYKSNYAGTNKATAATWAVDDVEKVVADLKAKGVTFEHYDFSGVTLEGDVHMMGKHKNAWFKDPDGNILSVVNR